MNSRVIRDATMTSIGPLVIRKNPLIVYRFKYKPSRKDLVSDWVVLPLGWFWCFRG